MDKIGHCTKRINIIIIFAGIVIVLSSLMINHGWLTWFSSIRWAEVSTISWISISSILSVGLVLQYFFLHCYDIVLSNILCFGLCLSSGFSIIALLR